MPAPRLDAAVPGRLPLLDSDELGIVVRGRAVQPSRAVATRLDLVVVPASLALVLLAPFTGLLGVWWTVAAWVIAGVAEWGARTTPRLTRLAELVGVGPIARAAIRAAALLVAVALAGGSAAGLSCLLVVLLVARTAEAAARAAASAVQRGQPPLVYVPRSAVQPPATTAYAGVYRRALAAPGPVLIAETLGVVAVLALGPGWVTPALLALLIWTGLVVRDVRNLQRDRRQVQTQLAELLAQRRPIALMYVSGGLGQVTYLLNPWLGALNALADQAVVVIREAGQLRDIESPAPLVLYAPTLRTLIGALPATTTVAFYPANGGGNTDLWRESRFKHVFLGHGDSDKATSATPIARVYDEVWVAGSLAVERYRRAGVDLPAHRLVMIGRPQVAPLTVGPRNRTPITVGYAPTFEGYGDGINYSSLERIGDRIVAELLRRPGIAVAFRPHPATGVQQPGMLASRQRIVERLSVPPHRVSLPGEPLWDYLNSIDVLITDVSSVASDFLYSCRPVVVVNTTGGTADEFVAAFPSQRGCYLVDADAGNLGQVLDDALGADPLRAERLVTRNHLHGDVPEGAVQRFVDQTRRLAAAAGDP